MVDNLESWLRQQLWLNQKLLHFGANIKLFLEINAFFKGTEKSALLTSLEITVTPLPLLCLCSFYFLSGFISDLIDGVTWIKQKILHCDFLGERYFILHAGNEDISFHPVFKVYPACWRLCPSLAHRTGTLGATRGPQCAEKGGSTWALAMWTWGEGWVFSLFRGSFCLRHSPLMRVNEDKLVWV